MRRTLPTEILMASRPRDIRYGNAWRFAGTAEELAQRAIDEPCWANEVLALAMTAVSQEDHAALRTALVALAGRAIGWIEDIDSQGVAA